MKQYSWIIAGAAQYDLHSSCLRTGKRAFRFSAENGMALLTLFRQTPGIPDADYNNFRRAASKSRAFILAGAGAFLDAGSPEHDGQTAVIDCGREGCHAENLEYFRDYLENGRHLGRGHLFVGTLPSTPLCEAAISLHLHGPAYYLDTLNHHDILWNEAEFLLENPELHSVLMFHFGRGIVTAFLAERGNTELSDNCSPEKLFEVIS